uniref:Endonuclease/exonuclease/phosphatase domain-containing protein n=1 Tax=Rhizophagus irregularis (strain DAOM 181602 / DAOM 197198 / MUCL 43194) TaxID=747089 RepID=U9T174_RHIID
MAIMEDHDMGDHSKKRKDSMHQPKTADDLKYFAGLFTCAIRDQQTDQSIIEFINDNKLLEYHVNTLGRTTKNGNEYTYVGFFTETARNNFIEDGRTLGTIGKFRNLEWLDKMQTKLIISVTGIDETYVDLNELMHKLEQRLGRIIDTKSKTKTGKTTNMRIEMEIKCTEEELLNTWGILINGKMIKIEPENYKNHVIKQRGRISASIMDIPEETNEKELAKQIKKAGARYWYKAQSRKRGTYNIIAFFNNMEERKIAGMSTNTIFVATTTAMIEKITIGIEKFSIDDKIVEIHPDARSVKEITIQPKIAFSIITDLEETGKTGMEETSEEDGTTMREISDINNTTEITTMKTADTGTTEINKDTPIREDTTVIMIIEDMKKMTIEDTTSIPETTDTITNNQETTTDKRTTMTTTITTTATDTTEIAGKTLMKGTEDLTSKANADGADAIERTTEIYKKRKGESVEGCINVRGLNDTKKQGDIRKFLDKEKWDIAIITETKLKESKDLLFKGKQKNIRIIGIYNPNNDKQTTTNIEKHLTKWMNESLNLDYETVILGDFNESTKNKKKLKPLINTIKKHGLQDIHESLTAAEDMLDTWKSGDNSSRIDFIFASESFNENIISHEIIDIEDFETDHKALTVKVELKEKLGMNKSGYMKNIKKELRHIKLEQEDWKKIAEEVELRLEGLDQATTQRLDRENTWDTIISINVTAFMDDTTLISKNKEQLERMIEICHQFFNINDVKANVSKYELIKINNEKEDLIIEGEAIKTNNEEGNRYLGIFFRHDNKREIYKKKITSIINNACNIFNWKRLNEKQIIAVWNIVIMPRIEYQLAAIILKKWECDKLMTRINMIIKKRAGLAKTTPNFIIYEKDILGVKHIYDLQMEMLCKNLLYQANGNNNLNILFKIKMIQEQKKLWTSRCPGELEIKNYRKNNWIISALKALNNEKIKICNHETKDFNENHRIQGGKTDLIDLIEGKEFVTSAQSRKSKNIIFLEDILEADGITLLKWKHLCKEQGLNMKEHKLLEDESGQVRKIKNEFVGQSYKESIHVNLFDENEKQDKNSIITWNVEDLIKNSIFEENELNLETKQRFCLLIDINKRKWDINDDDYKGNTNEELIFLANHECNNENEFKVILRSIILGILLIRENSELILGINEKEKRKEMQEMIKNKNIINKGKVENGK